MEMRRRSLLAACAGAWPAVVFPARLPSTASDSLGLVIHSFPVHQAIERGRPVPGSFADPIHFLEHCRGRGVHSVQVGLGTRDATYCKDLRSRVDAASMHLEGIVSLPKDQGDLERFETEVKTARQCGVTILRSVTLSGRRYETFETESAFRKFAEWAAHSLKLAAAVVRTQKMQLALENHKDWRADELITLLAKLGAEEIGICLDTGNSIALLENPMEVVETLAPRAFTTHFKDVALEESSDGFLLSEVPLGDGILDLERVVQTLRKARPEIRFNIEMITRDPLVVPCLTERYWATFPDLPGRHLARALSLVRAHRPRQPLPRPSRLTVEERVRIEDENVGRCIAFARQRLGL
jgi:sugar phosphate isomerase/epimerase